jgi:hypothetical protein
LEIPTLNDPFSDMSPTSPTIVSTPEVVIDPLNIPLPETPTSPTESDTPPSGGAPVNSKVLKGLDRFAVRWS